jgi:hypothetical protein
MRFAMKDADSHDDGRLVEDEIDEEEVDHHKEFEEHVELYGYAPWLKPGS